MRVSAKVDYAVRAAVELAAAPDGGLVKAQAISDAQTIPLKFLENILQQLRQADLVESTRGPHGGHRLSRPAKEITLADVIRAVDGPLGVVAGHRPEDVDYAGSAKSLLDVWIAEAQLLGGGLYVSAFRQARKGDSWQALAIFGALIIIGEDYCEGSSIMQERSHAFAM